MTLKDLNDLENAGGIPEDSWAMPTGHQVDIKDAFLSISLRQIAVQPDRWGSKSVPRCFYFRLATIQSFSLQKIFFKNVAWNKACFGWMVGMVVKHANRVRGEMEVIGSRAEPGLEAQSTFLWKNPGKPMAIQDWTKTILTWNPNSILI